MRNVEIAKRAGVSTATVSRVLRNLPGVSRTAIEKVEMVLHEEGYKLDVQRKRNKSVLKNRCIAFLVLGEDVLQAYSSAFMKTLGGVESVASDLGLTLIYAKALSLENLPPLVLDGAVDGLVLAGFNPRKDVIEKLRHIPSVWLSSHQENDHSVVLGGNEIIGRMAVNYLMGRKHSDLAVLNALSGHPAVSARRMFFEFYAKQSGCRSVQSYTNEATKDCDTFEDLVDEQKKLIDQLLGSAIRPSGLFIPLDPEVAIAYEYLHSLGIEIGKEIEIIGCNNHSMALMGLHPKPATIEIDAFAIGRRAAQELIWKVENPKEKSHQVQISIQPNLVVGGN